MKYPLYDSHAKKLKELDLNPEIFDVPINIGLVHQAATAQLANRRRPLAHTKDKSQVAGGGRKPWRQKGTGRARHGSIRSPLWKGGGVTFGPTKDRNFSQKINKKMKRKALFMALTDRAKDNHLLILDKFEIKHNKTKEFTALLDNLKAPLKLAKIKKSDKSAIAKDKPAEAKEAAAKKFDLKKYKISILFVTADKVAAAARITRNIPGVKALSAASLNIVDVLSHKNLLITQDTLKVMDQTYLK